MWMPSETTYAVDRLKSESGRGTHIRAEVGKEGLQVCSIACQKFKLMLLRPEHVPAALAYSLPQAVTPSVLLDWVAGVEGTPYMSCKQVGVIVDEHDDGTTASLLSERFFFAETGVTSSGWRLS